MTPSLSRILRREGCDFLKLEQLVEDGKRNSPEESLVFGEVQLGLREYSIYEVIRLENSSSDAHLRTKA